MHLLVNLKPVFAIRQPKLLVALLNMSCLTKSGLSCLTSFNNSVVKEKLKKENLDCTLSVLLLIRQLKNSNHFSNLSFPFFIMHYKTLALDLLTMLG